MGFFDFLKKNYGPEALDSAQGMLGYPRYGMPTDEKEIRARTPGAIPGAPETSNSDILDRDAAGYLTGENWGRYPGAARSFGFIADMLHKPFGDEDIQKYASPGIERGIQAYKSKNPNAKTPGFAEMFGLGDWN